MISDDNTLSLTIEQRTPIKRLPRVFRSLFHETGQGWMMVMMNAGDKI